MSGQRWLSQALPLIRAQCRQKISLRIILRSVFRHDITADHEVGLLRQEYRIRRIRDLNGQRRFYYWNVKNCVQRDDGVNAMNQTAFLHVDFKQPKGAGV